MLYIIGLDQNTNYVQTWPITSIHLSSFRVILRIYIRLYPFVLPTQSVMQLSIHNYINFMMHVLMYNYVNIRTYVL